MKSITVSAAEMLLYRLHALGIEYIFINSGTDYPPIIEAYSHAKSIGCPVPEFVICQHENAAIGMAHGYYLATGKMQAVMVHTNVGLANAVCGIINLANSNIPVLIFGGRTPVTEHSHFGCRNTPIGYGQEMRDQAALVRESVKWDFELRFADQIGEHVDRAWAIANSLPKGPVYLSLPREPLCETFQTTHSALSGKSLQQPVSYSPTLDSLLDAATLITNAKRPVIFSQRGAKNKETFDIISSFVKDWAIPVVEYWGTEVTISAEHPMYAGNEPKYWLLNADVVIVIDSQAPWMLNEMNVDSECKVIQIGPDPLFSRYPVRGYQADINLAGEVGVIFNLLNDMLKPYILQEKRNIDKRYSQIVTHNKEENNKRNSIIESGSVGSIKKPWLSYCLGVIANNYDGKVVSELTTLPQFAQFIHPESYYQEALSGGLGEAFPMSLGLQLADRDKLVIVAMGDGSYLFSNPAVCHHIAEIMELPVLVIIGNNAKYGAVAGGTLALYPDGYAASMNEIPTTSFTSSPDMSLIASSSRATTFKVSKAEELLHILETAINIIQTQKHSVLIDVILEN